jgi:hypothetical protein
LKQYVIPLKKLARKKYARHIATPSLKLNTNLCVIGLATTLLI